ncbi:hypothetical protein LOTGIDRAFT_204149 [Lottia gigantea]|uniref:Uncharacterized protein n=1 Tax=Lottia gigantea TaxID=225164 RepID=V4A6Z5_LOTGI|nr:hypothetical protein LOTGIDRAFT_204149 [Lottia gigantea]ESO90790.1 hypothetical protein LOTGIDRAFT_204149 [Lottia gigantea]
MILIIGALVAVAVADPSEPGCCLPPQWEGFQGAIIGQVIGALPKSFHEATKISYDETNNKIAYTVVETAGASSSPAIKIIQDYSEGQQYIINMAAQTCQPSALPKTFQKICLPADAKPLGKFYFGIGDTKLEAVSFGVYVNGANVTAVLTSDNCVPIFEVLTTANTKMAMMQALAFINITPGILNPDVFSIPDICKQRKPVSFGEAVRRTGLFSGH